MTYVHIYTDGTKDLFIVAAPTWSHKHINDDMELIVNPRLLVPTGNYDRIVSLDRSQIRVYFLKRYTGIHNPQGFSFTIDSTNKLEIFFQLPVTVLHV
jgi:hypothetical protein